MANPSNGGAFLPAGDYAPTGDWDFSEATVTLPGGTVEDRGSIALTDTTDQVATGTGSNITTSSYPASSGAVTLTFPSTTTTIVGTNTTNTLTNKTIASSAGVPYAAGVAAGYKVARVEMALDASNPTSWATGLTTIIAAYVGLKGTAAPGVGTSVLTSNINGTSLDVYAWKVTATGDCTLVASTGTETFYGIAIGT